MRVLITRLFAVLGVACLLSPALPAAEPVLEFVEGLRQRRYYDTALQYLDQAESLNLAPEVRQVLSYERAQTLLQSSQELANLDEQRKRLDAAQAAFEEFVKGASNHPLAGRANTARGKIFTEKARVEIWDGEKPSNEGNRENFRGAARTFLESARRIFQQARDQHEAAWKAFPTFIPEEDFKQRRDRDAAEQQYMEAQLDLAEVSYWESQTFAPESEERKKALEKAAFEFEEIHQKYRSQVAGLYARIWQGKCFEERGDIRIALGLYEEILGHEGSSDTMRNLKDRALRFRLICLNHESRRDYQLVVDEGERWVRDAKARARTGVGLGIQYEMGRALEQIGTDRTKADNERSAALNRALGYARTVNRYPGELKTPSSALIQRLMVALNRDPGVPKDFETAYGSAGLLYDQMLAQTTLITRALAEKRMKEAAELDAALEGIAGESARMYDLAVRLARPDTDPRLLSIAQLRLAYSYLREKRYLEAAVMGGFVMRTQGEVVPEAARDGGFIRMAAIDALFSDSQGGDVDFEAGLAVSTAEEIVSRWPESDRANDARNAVAKIYWARGELLQAADWWLKIPQGTAQYVDARLKAGKAYWRHYVLQASLPEDERPAAGELTAWKAAAIEHLETGLKQATAELPAGATMSDDMASSKLTLASIYNLDGRYQDALQLLTAEPHPIVKAVEVPAGQQRPQDASRIQSRQLASITYQQLLRSYIGIKDLDKARDARLKLEQVASSEDAAELTRVFVAFGAELEAELERLRAGNETERLNDVRAGFESFLNDLYARQDGQTFFSLLWIAETFASLADGSDDNPAKATEYFNKASSAYQSILDKAQGNPDFLPNADQVHAVKLRMVKTLVRQRNFEPAEQALLDVVRDKPDYSFVQFEAAQFYQEWGAAGGTDPHQKLQTALYGNAKDATPRIWGWQQTAQTIQRTLRQKPDPQVESLLFDAQYAMAEAERELGKVHPDLQEGGRHLERARSSITRFQRTSPRWSDEQYMRFNSLYRRILADMLEPVVDLPREATGGAGEDVGGGGGTQLANVNTAGLVNPAEQLAEPKSNYLLMILVLLLGTGAVGGLFYFAMNQTTGNRPKYEVAASGPKVEKPVQLGNIQLGGADPLSSLAGLQVSATKPIKPPAVKKVAPTSTAAAGTKPAPGRPAATGGDTAKAAVKRPATPGAQKSSGKEPTAGNPAAGQRPAARPQAPGAAGPGGTTPPVKRPAQGDGATAPPQKRPQSGEATPRPPQLRPPQGEGETPPPKRPRPQPPTPPAE